MYSKKRWTLSALMILVAIGVPCLSFQGHSVFPEPIRPWIFLFSIFSPVAFLIPLGKIQSHQRRFRAASGSQSIMHFEGVIETHPIFTQAFKKPVSANGLLLDSKIPQSIEVLERMDPVTGRGVVFRVNGLAVKQFKLASVGQASLDGQNRYKAHVSTYVSKSEKIVRHEQRHLSPAEKAELAGKIRRLFIGKLPQQMISLAIIFLILQYAWGFSTAILGGIPLFAWICTLRYRGIRVALKFRRDLIDGRVSVYTIEGDNVTMEHLHHTKALWALGEKPAPWRVV
jgi:hypothetical protein